MLIPACDANAVPRASPGATGRAGSVLRFCSMLALRLGALVLVTFAATLGCKSSATGSGGGGQGGATSSSGVGLAGVGGTNAGGADAGPLSCAEVDSTVPKGECDLLAQDCPPGQTCRANSDAAPTTTVCVAGTGLKGLGEDCKAHEECQAGLICVNQCTAPCCRATNQPCGGGQCNLQLNYNNGDYTFVCAFDKSCKLLEPNACPQGYGCHVDDPNQGLATCTKPSAKMAKDLDPCKFLNDCPSMEDCHDLSDGTGAHCHMYCYTDMSRGEGTPGYGGCPTGQSCITSLNSVPIDLGLPGIGLCNP
jgi:hypothetical protein